MRYRVTATPSLRLRESAPAGRILTNMPHGAIVEAIAGGEDWIQVIYVSAATPPSGQPLTGVAMAAYLQQLPAWPHIFDFPVGTPDERRDAALTWPGNWTDANPYGNKYLLRGEYAYHTGADLNLNFPSWDADRGAPVYAIAGGTITYAATPSAAWGKTVILRSACPDEGRSPDAAPIYARYAALATFLVTSGETVTRGQPIGTIGSHQPGEPNHLHFDISPTAVLATNPGDWPGLTWSRIVRDYLEPLSFILAHRARHEPPAPPETGDPDYTIVLPLLTAATNTATTAADAFTAHLEALTTLRDAIDP
jgi:hypothetical protein